MSKILYYFDLYGRAEPIRMLLAHAKVDFVDNRISNEEFAQMREDGTLPSGQVPLWQDGDRKVNQTAAIMRLLGKQHGYYSMDPEEGYKADWAMDTLGDIFKPDVLGKFFTPGDQITEEAIKETSDAFEKWAVVLENRLKSLDGNFFGGKTLSIGDFMIFAFFCSCVTNENVNSPPLRDGLAAKLQGLTNVNAWHEIMISEMKDHLAERPARFV